MSQFDPRPLAKQIDVRSASRPLQVAYIVEIGSDSDVALDEIFAESYWRWGGVNTPVIPILNGTVDNSHLEFLKWIDPDYIGVYGEIASSVIEKINRACCPHLIKKIHLSDKKSPSRSHRLDIDALDNFSLLPALKNRVGRRGTASPLRLLDAYPSAKAPRFVSDNFGLLGLSRSRFPPHDSIRGLAELVIYASENVSEERAHFPNLGKEVVGVFGLLREMRESKNVTSSAQLAAMLAPKFPEIERGTASESMTLVLGDTALDRVLFWNSRLQAPEWLSDRICSLNVSADLSKNDEFIKEFCEYLHATNWIAPPNHGGIGYLNIISASQTNEQIDEFAEKIRTNKGGWIWHSGKVEFVDVCPKAPASPTLFSSAGAISQHVSQTQFRLIAPTPFHLSEVTNFPALKRGSWSVDVCIERDQGSWYANKNDIWMLPKRITVARYFANRPSRAARFGQLSVLASVEKAFIDLNIPSETEFFRSLMFPQQHYELDDVRESIPSSGRVAGVSTSEEGKYLKGVTGLFGDVNRTLQFFDNRFWRRAISKLAEPARTAAENGLSNLLLKSFRGQQSVSLADTSDLANLLEVIKRAAGRLRQPIGVTNYSTLLADLKAEFDDAHRAWPYLGEQDEEATKAQLESALQECCALGVFEQGIIWTCRNCGHRNWRRVDELLPINKCATCRTERAMPVQGAWEFRLNDFLATSIREHGTLALIRTITALREYARHSFIWLPPFGIYRDADAERSAEIDLAAVIDGDFYLGEVKRSAAWLRDKDLETLAEYVKELNADGAIISCLDATTEDLAPRVKKLRQLLANPNLKVISLGPDNVNGAPSHFI